MGPYAWTLLHRNWDLTAQHGFDHNDTETIEHYSDVAYANGQGTGAGNGFNYENNYPGSEPRFKLYSVISAGHTGTNHYNLRVYADSQILWESDFNLYWNSSGDARIRWGSTDYSDVSDFSGTGNDEDNSVEADPLFLDPANARFYLGAGSPAIDKGGNGAFYDFLGQSRVDDPVASNGILGYQDIGAFEFVNIVTNPSFEADATGWANYPSSGGPTSARVSGGQAGSWSLEVTGAANTSVFGINDSPDWVADTQEANRKYRFTAWVKSASHTGKAKLRVREYRNVGGSQVGSNHNSIEVNVDTTWRQITLDVVNGEADTHLDLQVLYTPNGASEAILIDHIAIALLPKGH